MEKITDLTNPPIVGHNYLVRCVKSCAANWCKGNRTIPVNGSFHCDKEIIGFPEEHIHIDFRFISNKELRRLNVNDSLFGRVVSKKFVEFECWEVRRCNRLMPKFPKQTLGHHLIWMPELEKTFRDKQIACGRCPHQGIDLRLINCDRSLYKVCPGHGLKWNKQGQLVPQTI